MNKKYFRL